MDSIPGNRLQRTYETPYGVLSAAEVVEVLSEAQNHRCCYCGIVMVSPYYFQPPDRCRLTIEHVISRSRGGADTWDNIVAACRQCNSWRSADKLSDGMEISAIAWFYKQAAGEDVRPYRQRRRAALGLHPYRQRRRTALSPRVLAAIAEPPRPAAETYFAQVYQRNEKREQKIGKRSKPFSKRKSAAKRRARAQQEFCGHSVQFGSNRLPNNPTPSPPVEGASLGSLWPK